MGLVPYDVGNEEKDVHTFGGVYLYFYYLFPLFSYKTAPLFLMFSKICLGNRGNKKGKVILSVSCSNL